MVFADVYLLLCVPFLGEIYHQIWTQQPCYKLFPLFTLFTLFTLVTVFSLFAQLHCHCFNCLHSLHHLHIAIVISLFTPLSLTPCKNSLFQFDCHGHLEFKNIAYDGFLELTPLTIFALLKPLTLFTLTLCYYSILTVQQVGPKKTFFFLFPLPNEKWMQLGIK